MRVVSVIRILFLGSFCFETATKDRSRHGRRGRAIVILVTFSNRLDSLSFLRGRGVMSFVSNDVVNISVE